MSGGQLPIETLVWGRCRELMLSSAELVRRCGYKNVSKGLRRLEQLCRADFKSSAALISALPRALEVPAYVVKCAVEETQRRLYEADEAAWRVDFRPHAVILTEKSRPEPMFVAAVIGVDRLLRVDFDLADHPVSYIKQALTGMRQKLARWNASVDASNIGLGELNLPAYGRPVGVVINYTPQRAVRFDLDGNAVEIVDRAFRLSAVQLSLGGRRISQAELDAIFSADQGEPS